ncbi:lysosomal acid glucosylceramidase-like [Nylanderia fulva]|uniref:lysosomal acid glucosylceramidase-like n=1 Tax=Nylanderia fulva TaxID=613905 RepID=UPI0010FB77AB|nr:lysosomal acid glucosylceramidase-like [Nylanderia fulva]XP_029158300.1 lysosomal acid glucosylceramidase-like [Nylanderia fulva]
MWRLIILVAISVTVTSSIDCVKRRSTTSGDDGHYCVCNAKRCDQTPDVIKPQNLDEYTLITSNKNGLRFRVSKGLFKETEPKRNSKSRTQKPSARQISEATTATKIFCGSIKEKNVNPSLPGKIIINQTQTYQEILGFGGAVTDSAAINIFNLTQNASDNLIKSYFGPHGINYNFIRTPMGGSDFSTRTYTYAMTENDITLSNFNLQMEDYDYKIPLIKRAQELKENKIKLLTVPWTAAPWMKINNDWMNRDKLRPEYRQLWADYFVKYFEAYRNAGLEFWGVSSQNEPASYIYLRYMNFTSMAWTPEEERDWIIEYLSPTLQKKGFGHIKIFAMDDNRIIIPGWPNKVFQDKRARDIISGIAVHFYFDLVISPNFFLFNLGEIKKNFPEKLILYTEASAGIFDESKVILGSWKRGEIYVKSIIETMSNWASSWIDWNIALDMTGGPNWINNYVDSPIIVNSAADEFYKQPMFYALGHFSKYVPPNSVRIDTTTENMNNVENIAFSTSDGGVVLVILNLNEKKKAILIEDPEKGKTKINVPARSINTIKYWTRCENTDPS